MALRALAWWELPDWLDAAVEGYHGDLAIALLSVFVEAQALAVEAPRPSVPNVSAPANPFYEPVGCENFS